MASRKKSRKVGTAAAPVVEAPATPIEQKAAKARRVAPRRKNVIQMPFFLRSGVKVTVEGDVEDFTWDAKHDRLIISTGLPADQVVTAPTYAPHPQARILGPSVPSGSVEASGVEYTDLGPSEAEARMYAARPGTDVPPITSSLDEVLDRMGQKIAVEKLNEGTSN